MDQLEARPERLSHVKSRPQEQQLSLFNTQTAEFFVLNSTGRFVWEACDGTNTVGGIVEKLIEACATPPERSEVVRDVGVLVEEMKDKGLVRW